MVSVDEPAVYVVPEPLAAVFQLAKE